VPEAKRRVGGAKSISSGLGGAPPRKRDLEVVDAAVKVFYERGYSDATVQDVADELGILKGSLYHYIRTKEDLLFRVFEDVHRDVDALLEEVRAIERLEPAERLRLYVVRQVKYNLANLPRITIYYHEMERLGEERGNALRARRRANERYIRELVQEMQDAGQADPSLDAQLLTNCLFATIIWTYRWYRPNGRASRDTIAEVCASYALHGIVGSLGTAA
jgi:AcrR family transcriptional regulator